MRRPTSAIAAVTPLRRRHRLSPKRRTRCCGRPRVGGGCTFPLLQPCASVNISFLSGPGKRQRFDSKHVIFLNSPLRLLQTQAQAIIEQLCTSRITTMPVAVIEQFASATPAPATRRDISSPVRLMQLGGRCPNTKLGRASV